MCDLTFPEDGIETLPGVRFWMHNMALGITPAITLEAHGGLMLLAGPSWVTQCRLSGPAEARAPQGVRGIDVEPETSVFLEGVRPPVVAMQQQTRFLEGVRPAHIQCPHPVPRSSAGLSLTGPTGAARGAVAGRGVLARTEQIGRRADVSLTGFKEAAGCLHELNRSGAVQASA